MSKTFYQDDAAAFVTDVTGHGLGNNTVDPFDPIYKGTHALTSTPGGSAPLDYVIQNSGEAARFFLENEGETTRVSTGTVIAHVNITATGSTTGTMKVRAWRVNSSGAAQISSAYTATQLTTTGIKTFPTAGGIDISGLGTWNAGDRLALEVWIHNDNSHGGADTYTITVGTTDANDDVVASDFTGPPTITAASMSDAGRSFANSTTDVIITFDQALSSATVVNAGDTVPGLTIGPSGTEGAVTYVSGEGTTSWTVRRAALAKNGDSWVIDYGRTAGDLLSGGAVELSETPNFAITNNLTKRVRFTLKKSDNAVVASETVKYYVGTYDTGAPASANWMTREMKGTVATDASGVVDVQYTGGSAVGGTVYVGVIRPDTTPTESMLWTDLVT